MRWKQIICLKSFEPNLIAVLPPVEVVDDSAEPSSQHAHLRLEIIESTQGAVDYCDAGSG
jgi:hypothetical protein